jgi:AsmA family protein
MPISLSLRRVLTWALSVAAGLLLIIVVSAAALDAGYLRHALLGLLAADVGRRIQVEGSLQTHLFSRHPHFVADHVTILNPSWMPAGVTATIDRLTLDLAIPGSGHWVRVDRLVLEGTSLVLKRDAEGHTNWQLRDSDNGRGGLPLIRSLSVSNARTKLDDERRHLHFDGQVSVQDQPDSTGTAWLRIDGAGQLNGAAIDFDVTGDPLMSASHDRPYRFSFNERSKTTQLNGRGALSHAFDFNSLDTTFETSGENLKDLYYLVGVHLIATGNYKLSGNLTRRGSLSTFDNLLVTSGASDMSGRVTVDTLKQRPVLSGDLRSRNIRLSDLGARAAHPESVSASARPYLLSDAALNPSGVRHGDATVNFHVDRVEAGRVSLQQLAGKLVIEHGILSVAPFTADVLDGRLGGQVRMNASSDIPTDELDVQLSGLQIGLLDHNAKGPPRFEALMNAHIHVTGRGSSLHQLATTANGSITSSVPSGTLRQSFAEISGLDWRGLGLLLTKSQHQTGIRCAAANFEASDGILNAQNITIDTDDVLITGEGNIALATEELHIALRGHPKQVRLLRVSAPILVSGTLLHPAVGLEHPRSVALVDRGATRNADCATLLAH